MACDQPPPLSDEEINAALDGIASEDVMEHLSHCAGCRARLVEVQRFQHRLQTSLHRWDCPAPERLGVYHLGLLSSAEERGIVAHLRHCVRCADEIEVLRAFLADGALCVPSPSPAVKEQGWQPRRTLGTLVARLLPARPGFGAAALRGNGRMPLIAQSPVATIVLDPVMQGPSETMLVGQIADDEDDQDRWTGALVAAYLGGAFVGAAVVDDLGSFTCGPLPEGKLEIHITAEAGPSIRIDDVPI